MITNSFCNVLDTKFCPIVPIYYSMNNEFDLINALMSNSNNEAFKRNLENFITPQNFKEKFNTLIENVKIVPHDYEYNLLNNILKY